MIEIFGIPYLKKGSGIHIKKKNRGKFTEYCGGEVTNECILRAKNSKNPKLRKRATFALNARGWTKRHQEGGVISKNTLYNIYRFEQGGLIPKFLLPWRTLLVSRKQPKTLNDLMSDAKVVYNNIIRKTKNVLSPRRNPGEVIDLSDEKISRITPETKNATAIYGNEFVENNANNIRTKKQFEETTDTLIGDRKIPLSNINNFYGIENGKLRAGNLSSFQDSTTVVPNRVKGAQRIKEVIFPTSLEKQNYRDKWIKIMKDSDQTMAHAAYELGIGFSPFFNSIFHGYAYRKMRNLAKDNKTSSPAVAKWENARMAKRAANAELRKGSDVHFVTESNDTIPSNVSNTNKAFFANELGNSMFVNKLSKLGEQDQNKVNVLLKQHPMYPILIDNGRYSHYQKKNPNYTTYTKYDFVRDPKSMYIIGTTESNH